MEPRPTIRSETDADRTAIGNVIRSAFAGKPYAAGDEAELVEVLRREGALTVSLVAELNSEIIGQIALSPAATTDGRAGWYALGPVSVLPVHQRRRIGSELVNAGLRSIVALGAEGCILTGDPSYYARFGFVLSPSNVPNGEPPEFFMVKRFGTRMPSGPISFHWAFTTHDR